LKPSSSLAVAAGSRSDKPAPVNLADKAQN
jgi:hypothetical protein